VLAPVTPQPTTGRSNLLHLCRLFLGLLHAVIRAPVRYFETTAHGVLLNRFSGDMSRVDGYLPDDFARCVIYSLSLGCSVGILCAVAPLFSVAVVVLAPVFYLVGRG